MQIAIINNGSVVKVGHYRTLFPYTVFPDSGPSDQWLADNSCLKVNLFLPHDRETQVLDRAEPYIQDGWVYTVQVRDMTEEELAAYIASKATQKRAERDRALAASDWTQVLDAPVDRTVWATYRQALRDLPDAEGFPDVSLPVSPGFSDISLTDVPGSSAGNIDTEI